MSDDRYTLRQAMTRVIKPRLAPLDQLVLTREFEQAAKAVLPAAAFAAIAAGERSGLDRITFRPRVMRPTSDLDLSSELFGTPLYTPIAVGAVSDQSRFHPQAELATARGAAAAGAVMVISDRAHVILERIAASAAGPFWFRTAVDPQAATRIQAAAKAGCRVAILSLAPGRKIDWDAVERVRHASPIPVLVRGITVPAEAVEALRHGIAGLVVSRGEVQGHGTAPILLLPGIVAAVEGKVPVLVDGDFQLGSDVMKALVFGAKAVLVERPPMWGLAAYGSDGVRGVLEMMQADLARTMCMCGCRNLAALNENLVRRHAAV